jgi:hypothetical protein
MSSPIIAPSTLKKSRSRAVRTLWPGLCFCRLARLLIVASLDSKLCLADPGLGYCTNVQWARRAIISPIGNLSSLPLLLAYQFTSMLGEVPIHQHPAKGQKWTFGYHIIVL